MGVNKTNLTSPYFIDAPGCNKPGK
jgi:hypothetical protein